MNPTVEAPPKRRLLHSTAHETDIPQPNPTDRLREIIGDEGFTDIVVGNMKLRICDDEYFNGYQAAVPPYPISLYNIWVLVGSPETDLDPKVKQYTEALALCGGGCDCHTSLYLKTSEENTRLAPPIKRFQGLYYWVTRDLIGMSGYNLWHLTTPISSNDNTFCTGIVEKVLKAKAEADRLALSSETTSDASPKPQG